MFIIYYLYGSSGCQLFSAYKGHKPLCTHMYFLSVYLRGVGMYGVNDMSHSCQFMHLFDKQFYHDSHSSIEFGQIT